MKGATPTGRPLIALDGDGVLLDYHDAYARLWHRVFDHKPTLTRPDAYFAMDAWGLPRLAPTELARFRAGMDREFWLTMKALPGAVEACRLLVAAGYDLVCVSALDAAHAVSRQENLVALGFPISRTCGVGNESSSPKAACIAELRPVAFVDNLLDYMQGIDRQVTHCALLESGLWGSPNTRAGLAPACSVHPDLLSFARWWRERSRDQAGASRPT